MTNDKELAALKARVAELERAQPSPPIDPDAVARWRDEMRAIEDRRVMNYPHSREQLAAYRAACPDDQASAIVRDHRNAPRGASQAGSSGRVDKVSSNAGLPGSGTGWQSQTPLGPPPGVAQADRLMDAANRADRAALIQRDEAVRRAEALRKARGG